MAREKALERMSVEHTQDHAGDRVTVSWRGIVLDISVGIDNAVGDCMDVESYAYLTNDQTVVTEMAVRGSGQWRRLHLVPRPAEMAAPLPDGVVFIGTIGAFLDGIAGLTPDEGDHFVRTPA